MKNPYIFIFTLFFQVYFSQKNTQNFTSTQAEFFKINTANSIHKETTVITNNHFFSGPISKSEKYQNGNLNKLKKLNSYSESSSLLHLLSIEVQYIPNMNYTKGHTKSSVIYSSNCSKFQYRLLYVKFHQAIFGGSLGLNYRELKGSYSRNDLSESYKTTGDLKYASLELGSFFGRLIGKNERVLLGGGINIGNNIWQDGTAFRVISSNIAFAPELSEVLKPIHVSFHIEANNIIKLYKRNYILLGAKFYIENSDSYFSRTILSMSAAISYGFN